MKLADLFPRISPPGGQYQELVFRCPRCQQHEILVGLWNGPAGNHDLGGVIGVRRLWHAEQGPMRDWETLSLMPSIDRSGIDSCGGWHGFITNGECNP